jgi:hypothetical protein
MKKYLIEKLEDEKFLELMYKLEESFLEEKTTDVTKICCLTQGIQENMYSS